MRYIVWRNRSNGYFVSYKDKIDNEYSIYWYNANRYKSLKSAMSRLGLELNLSMKTMDDFFDENPVTKSYFRDRNISKVLNEPSNNIVIFESGFIDLVDDNDEYVGNAGKEILEFVEKVINNNVKYHEIVSKKLEQLNVNNYIDTVTPDEDFWNEVLNK